MQKKGKVAKISWKKVENRYTLKILTLAAKRSFLSIPSLRGIAPTMKAASTSLKPTSGLAVQTTPLTRDKAVINIKLRQILAGVYFSLGGVKSACKDTNTHCNLRRLK